MHLKKLTEKYFIRLRFALLFSVSATLNYGNVSFKKKNKNSQLLLCCSAFLVTIKNKIHKFPDIYAAIKLNKCSHNF